MLIQTYHNQRDSNFFIITQLISKDLQEELFEHTKQFCEGRGIAWPLATTAELDVNNLDKGMNAQKHRDSNAARTQDWVRRTKIKGDTAKAAPQATSIAPDGAWKADEPGMSQPESTVRKRPIDRKEGTLRAASSGLPKTSAPQTVGDSNIDSSERLLKALENLFNFRFCIKVLWTLSLEISVNIAQLRGRSG